MIIRNERPEDSEAVRRVNEDAFGRTAEADLVQTLHAAGAIICSLVADEAGDVVGHILFSPATLDSHSDSFPVAALGPMAVLPQRQNGGVGSALVRAGLEVARGAGYSLTIVLGHPGFYPRFGFRPSAPLGIRWDRDVPEEVFMVAELTPGALTGAQGVVHYHPAFEAV